MNFFQRHSRTILLITTIGFLFGAFVGFGGYYFTRGWRADTVATVNNKKIFYHTYLNYLQRVINNLREQNQDITDELIRQKKQEILSDLIQEEIFYQEAKKYGINVIEEELIADIQHFPAFQSAQGGFDQNTYFQVLHYALRMTPEEFEESRRRTIAIAKLRSLIASSIKVSTKELELAYLEEKGDLKNYFRDYETFRQNYLSKKTVLVFNEWFQQLGRQAKIKVYLEEREKGG